MKSCVSRKPLEIIENDDVVVVAPLAQIFQSCGIDELLLDAAGIREFQYIEIYNINNGERFNTYAIRSGRGSGQISLNGAAARKALVGDLLIIAAYAGYSEADLQAYQPTIVLVDERNRPKPQ